MPFFVVDRDPHLLWIAVVQTVFAAVVLVVVIVLWVVHVRIMVKPIPVACTVAVTPRLPEGLLSFGRLGGSKRNYDSTY